MWDLSSAGRASALQAEGHRFEPYRSHILPKYYGEIAQLARAHGSYPWCRGFKSLSRYLRVCYEQTTRKKENTGLCLHRIRCSLFFVLAATAMPASWLWTDIAKLWKLSARGRRGSHGPCIRSSLSNQSEALERPIPTSLCQVLRPSSSHLYLIIPLKYVLLNKALKSIL